MPIEKSERSIIKIIAEMVREGETEEKIIRNLCELGAMEDEARRMVLIAHAQTYDSLKEEISRIVESNISAEKPFLRDFLKKQISETAKRKVLPGPEEKQKRNQGNAESKEKGKAFKRRSRKKKRVNAEKQGL